MDMQVLLIYLLKATVYSGIFFLYYHLALRNRRFHYYNRFYLLMSVALSIVLPFLNITLWQVQSNNRQIIQLMNVVVVNSFDANAGYSAFALSWNTAAMLLYALVVCAMLVLFAVNIYKLIYYKRIYPSEQFGTILFINTDLQQAPFSFFNNLFWKNTIDIGDETGKQIFKHELTHIKEKHSWDKVFLRITTLVFWINPFYWLMQKELSLIHEFIADEKAIEDNSAEAFALMLLQSHYGKNIFSPAQSFNYSPIKRRLLMLTTSKKPSFSYARRVLVLPLLAITMLLFAFNLKENKQASALLHTNAPFTLLIDAGHGGDAAGAVGINNILEKDINLAIARKVQELAPQYGITVKMTRTEDITMDPKKRMNVVEAVQPNAFVSIHLGSTEEKQTSKKEMNIYITRNETNTSYAQSRLLGSSLLQLTKNDFPVNPALVQRKEEGIFVIDQNPYPAALIECGYMNNEENIKQLTDAVKVEQLAKDILQGVVAYANAASQTINKEAADTSGKTPLYYVDGKETPAADAQKINPAAIESINVLKGNDAIKKYGEKGKNGVVLIQLKNGKEKAAVDLPDSINIDLKTNTVIFPTANMTIRADKTSMKTDVQKQPVFLVDGKEITESALNKIPPNSIYSISVWKGEEAIRKYGEKGRNGVVEIKMKSNEQKQTPDFAPPVSAKDTLADAYNADLENYTSKAESYEKVFESAQVAPSFPGGKEGWLKYLQTNLHTDIPIQHSAPTGTYTVIVSFIVAEDGSVSDVKADKDPGYGTGAEAVRIIKEGPKWIPAQQNGRNVTANTKQAITFRVEER